MKYFAYCRKSSEAEERQALSLESQIAELRRAFGDASDIEIIDVIFESMSAKAPGRPLLNKMLDRIRTGEADGILAWHPDRLARNSVDGGQIIYLLDQGVLKDMRFASFTFENSSQGKFMLQIMFGYSKYYVDNLSENIRRGNRARAARGWRPGGVPIGYAICRDTGAIIADPQQFPIIQRIFSTALEGTRSVNEIWRLATYEWGLRTRRRRRSGNGMWTRSAIYRALRNEFYSGYFVYGGIRHRGKHPPAVSPSAFARLQGSLRGTEPRRPSRYKFTYTGLIRCGACGLSVTAEHKVNRHGHRYIYYHCTKRNVGQKCAERSVNATELETQISEFLGALRIDESIDRALRAAAVATLSSAAERDSSRKGLKENTLALKRQETIALDLRVKGLISDEEFASKREEIQRHRELLTDALSRLDSEVGWFEPFEETLLFSNMALDWYNTGNDEIRRLILQTVGSNPTLKSRQLSIGAVFPFSTTVNISNVLHERSFVDEVRTRLISGDPDLIQRIENIRTIKRLVSGEDQPGGAA